MNRLATDADLVARLPELVDVDPALRAFALEDAAELVDVDLAGGKSLRLHVLLTAHYLALTPSAGLEATGPVASARAGEIAASFAVSSIVSDGPHSSSAYGRAFDALMRYVPHAPLAV